VNKSLSDWMGCWVVWSMVGGRRILLSILFIFFFVDSNNWLGWVEMMGPKLVTVYVDGLKLMFL
jgi:hypothetical protein